MVRFPPFGVLQTASYWFSEGELLLGDVNAVSPPDFLGGEGRPLLRREVSGRREVAECKTLF